MARGAVRRAAVPPHRPDIPAASPAPADTPAPGAPSSPRRISAAWALGLAALVAVAYGPALSNGYAYDSVWMRACFEPRPMSDIRFLWDPTAYWADTRFLSYRPLAVATFFLLDFKLLGAVPALSHAINLALHWASAWLLFDLARRALASAGRSGPVGWRTAAAGLGAAVFAAHPLGGEAVLCAGFRPDLAATLALLAALRFGVAGGGGWRRTAWVSFAATLAGLGFKESAAMALVLLPVWALVVGRGVGRERRMEAAAAFAGAAVAIAIFLPAWLVFRYPGVTAFLGGGGRPTGMANFAAAASEIYLSKLLWPWPLRIEHGFEPLSAADDGRLAVAAARLAAAGAALVCGAWWAARAAAGAGGANRLAAIGFAWVVAGFAPVAQLVPVPEAVAERFCYLPLAGMGFWVAGIAGAIGGGAAGGERGGPKARRLSMSAATAAAWALVTVWVIVSHVRAGQWIDDHTLNIANWEIRGEDRPRAHEALANIYLARAARREAQGRRADALADLDAATRHARRLMAQRPNAPATLETARRLGLTPAAGRHETTTTAARPPV